MPDLLAIGEGLARGAEKATQNLWNISQARQQVERQKKLDEIRFKQADLELKALEDEMSPEMVQARKDALKAESRNRKAKFALNLQTIRDKQAEEQRKTEQAASGLALLNSVRSRIGGTGDMGQGNVMDLTGVLKDLEGFRISSTGETTYTAPKKVAQKAPPTPFEIHKEARTMVNALIDDNITLQQQIFENPKMLNDMIDQQTNLLTEKYGSAQSAQVQPTIPLGSAEVGQQQEIIPEKELKDLGITEEELQHTMTIRNLSREQVLKKLRKVKQKG